VDVAVGSNASFLQWTDHFRSAPISGQSLNRSAFLKWCHERTRAVQQENHLITPSATAESVGEISSCNALAVLRLSRKKYRQRHARRHHGAIIPGCFNASGQQSDVA
jgi:hypothetical protein